MLARWLGCALLLVPLFGCSTKPTGEFGAACAGGLDEDHDGLIDCADPDCFGAEVCRGIEMSHPISGGMDAGRHDAGGVTPKMDAAAPPARDAGSARDAGQIKLPEAAMPELDAGDDDGGSAPLDASVPTCQPPCTADQECVANGTQLKCEQVAANNGGSFKLSITAATVANFASDGTCTECPDLGIWICPPLCGLVDPYVIAQLTHQTETTVVLATSYQTDTLFPAFDNDPVSIMLAAGDVLTFQAWDHDDQGEDRLLFECKPSLRAIPGAIMCSRLLPFANWVTIYGELDTL